ncbi:DUF6446 family protein [Amaricoccus solimangrovi]|uniref:Histidine kinase n=1 Tax=Amaricoccus solimangrovi TaxID=2589815 RepID=A0A501WQZ5_9RHOB|nr:DUF6446 family protein [Amaricoccus solimangrovi]TPE50765.1 histidine kinase [Amaricoccus solimangrovi]
MNGKRLVQGFLVFLAIFAAALIYTQFFAYYTRERGVETLRLAGAEVPVSDYDGIDSASSPLKLRGCFRIDPAAVAALPPAADATPLTPPFWFRCFDAGALTEDLASGAATARVVTRDDPKGFDEMIAVYPDGRGYLWRQLNAAFRDE